jgi:hypothetical protein
MDDLNMLLVGGLTAAILGGAKMLLPIVKNKVPNFMWPIAALVLAKVGTHLCVYLDVTCSGNPLTWTSVDASTASAALVAILAREGTKSTQKGAKKGLEWAREKGYIPPAEGS